ncbi:MAG TPA: DUF5915 domain-containing protein, partial [Chloroflexota bacterium]|nr:DUF5915 domain-containing protein [Chloroflexota bacterium]
VWTTTPWTLAANVAAAVHPELTYVKVRQGADVLYVSKGALANAVRGKHEVLGDVAGSEMEGWRYRGPFDELSAVAEAGAPEAHRVIVWKDVSDAEGTGIVHIAPGCGKEDFELGKEFGLPAIAPLDEFGNYLPGYDWLTGQNAAAVPQPIVDDLTKKSLLLRAEPYTHRYPHCWRCHSQLVFRLVDEWFISMDGLREEIMDVVRKIRWIPSWGLERELDWLRNMGDWMISKKNRYWGLALPFWVCESCNEFEVIGSESELEERATEGWEEFEGHSPHKPWIDAVKIECRKCGGKASRIGDVGNPWLDAGIVTYSTLGYREDRDFWEKWFPADFITESFPGQFRNWFYSLLTMSTVLENREPFKAVLGYQLMRDERGEEMHKSKGNSIEFNEAADRVGASVMRWLFTGASLDANLNFGFSLAEDVKRKLLTLWNVYAFFSNYARLDGFDPTGVSVEVAKRPALDRWILAELFELVKTATDRYENFDAATVTRRVEAFVDDLSNWYVRRGRPRYWRSVSDDDKTAAYLTLWEVLTTLARLLAPAMPFLAEELYQNLVRGVDASAPESVHHCEWPEANTAWEDEVLRDAMRTVRQVVGLARAARQKSKMKVRQPLPALLVRVKSDRERQAVASLEDQILDELNVKRVELVEETADLVSYKIKPNFKLLGPRFGPQVNAVAKALQEADAAELARRRTAGEHVALVVGGLEVDIPSEEFDVETAAAEGYEVIEEGGYLVALDTRLSPELREEGLARELVRRLNDMRKDAGFRVEDRIVTYYAGEEPAQRVFERFADYIRQETLSVRLECGRGNGAAHAETVSLDGVSVALAVERV